MDTTEAKPFTKNLNLNYQLFELFMYKLIKKKKQTCCSHVFACPDWLEADKRYLHRHEETHDEESCVC